MHLSAESGSSNSAKPKPWGLLAGVMRRLKTLTGPHAWTYSVSRREKEDRETITAKSLFKKSSVMPPDIDPTKRAVCLWVGGAVAYGCWSICCCCARADIEGPWPYDGKGGRRPSPSRFGTGCMFCCGSLAAKVELSILPWFRDETRASRFTHKRASVRTESKRDGRRKRIRISHDSSMVLFFTSTGEWTGLAATVSHGHLSSDHLHGQGQGGE